MPQAPEGPRNVKRVKRKPSVSDAIKKNAPADPYGAKKSINRARARSQRVQRKVANQIATSRPLPRRTLQRIGADAPKVVAPRPFRLVDPITPAAKVKAARDEVSTYKQLQKVSDRARKDLNVRGGSKAKFEKRDAAIETLKTVKDLPGVSKVQQHQDKEARKAYKRKRKEMREEAMKRHPVGENKPAIRVERPSLKTVGQVASGEALAEPAAALKKGLDELHKIAPRPAGIHTVAKRKRKRSTLAVIQAAAGPADRKVVLNAGKDAVDIAANAVPSVYLPAREVAKGRPEKAVKMLAEGAKEAVTKPTEHPLAAALTVSGAYGAAGRGAGKALRVATRDRVGSIKGRPSRSKPGTMLEERRFYSKNIITKQVQKRTDKKNAEVSPSYVKRRVDYAMARNEGVRRTNRTEVVRRADEAIRGPKGKPRVRLERTRRGLPKLVVRRRDSTPTAATQVASQRIVTGKGAALLDNLREYHTQAKRALAETEAKMAAGRSKELRPFRNSQARAVEQLEHAIRNFDAADVAKRADEYAKLSAELQGNLVELKLLNPEQAVRARVTPYAVQKMGARHDGDSLVDAGGRKLSTDEIVAHMRENGVEDAAFITQRPAARGARNYYVAQHGGVRASSPTRTGEAVRKGAFDMDPETMIEAAAHAQGLADAATGWTRVLGEFGYREKGAVKPAGKSYRQARALAEQMTADGKGEWVPVKALPFGSKREQFEHTFEEASALEVHQRKTDMLDAVAHGHGTTPKDTSGRWVIVPREAAQRLDGHIRNIGRGGVHPLLTTYSSLFRGVVLSTSPKWLTGNIAEAGLRSAVAHAGPRSYLTGRRWWRDLERLDPEYAKLVREEVLGGGHYAMSKRVNVHTDASRFDEGHLRRMATIVESAGKAPVSRWVPAAWRHWTDFVFNTMNRGIERQFQTAMAGKAVRDQLIPESLVKLSSKAIEDAARQSLDLNTVVALGRAVDKMYGRYSKFSPGERYIISTYTPFIRWALNALEFVYLNLPKDNPVLTALIASAYVASEDWREDKGLAMFVEEALPGFLQGSIPGDGGSHLRVSRYTPFGAFSSQSGIAGTLADALLPQFMGPYDALAHQRNWKQQKIKPEDAKVLTGLGVTGASIEEAGKQFLGGVIPFLSPFNNITQNEGDVKTKIRKQVDPFMYTQPKSQGSGGVKGVKPVKTLKPVKPLKTIKTIKPVK